MAIPPSAANTLTPMAWPSALPQAQPYLSQPNVGLPEQGVTTFTPSTPQPEATPTLTSSKQSPYPLLLAALGGAGAGSLLPNPLGLFKGKKETALSPEMQAALKQVTFDPKVEQRALVSSPNDKVVFVSPLAHNKFTRIEIPHTPEESAIQPTLVRLLKASKDNNLPASTVITDPSGNVRIPVFAHPKSTFNPDELATKLQAHLDAGTKPELKLAEPTLTNAEVDTAIKGQKMTFITPEAETTFKTALANESDPLAKAGAEVADRMAKLFQHHEAKGEHLFDVADKVIPNAMPKGLADKALITLAELAPAGSAIRSANEGKQEILQEALLQLNKVWDKGELLAHFMQLTKIK